jgi:ATP-binding cassette, subfamily B, bacterial PglK
MKKINELQNVRTLLHRIYLKNKFKFGLTIFIMILSSIFELISIGTIIPFLSSIAAPEILLEGKEFRMVIEALNISNQSELVLYMTILFCSFAIISAIVRIINLRMMTFFSFKSGHQMGVEMFSTILNKDFMEIQQFTSGDVINNVTRKADSLIYENLFPAFTVINTVVLGSMIVLLLFVVEPLVTGIAFIFIGSFYFIVNLNVRSKLFTNSRIVVAESNRLITVIQDSLGAIRDVILYRLQGSFILEYITRDSNLREAQARNQIIATLPKFLVEALGMIVLASVGYFYAQSTQTSQLVIPVLGALAFGVQKLLPLVQQTFHALSSLKAGSVSLDDILAIILNSTANDFNNEISALEFKEKIELKDISFRYSRDDSSVIFDKINLTVSKGDRIGVVGVTGSGKSTLVDLISGLLFPSSGMLLVDGKELTAELRLAWQQNIAYVHQSIYIINGTILENISFLAQTTDSEYQWAQECVGNACLDQEVIKKYGINNDSVGERGNKLSGGQRQRLGLARALYRNAKILILDEATNALDSAMEKNIMENIYRLDPEITIFIIAHRLDSLNNCQTIWNVEDGHVQQIRGK